MDHCPKNPCLGRWNRVNLHETDGRLSVSVAEVLGSGLLPLRYACGDVLEPDVPGFRKEKRQEGTKHLRPDGLKPPRFTFTKQPSNDQVRLYDAFCMMLYDALCRSMSSSDFTIIHSLCGSPACIAKPSSFSAAASLAVSLGKLRQAISRLDLEDSKAAKKNGSC